MSDHNCPHFSRIGSWCRLASNFKCSAKPGRVGCPFPEVGSLESRNAERNIARGRNRFEQTRTLEELQTAFAPSDVIWHVVSFSQDRNRALVRGELSVSAITTRLDAALGPLGWQEHYNMLGNNTVKCALMLFGISKEAVAEGESIEQAHHNAFRAAAQKFGIGASMQTQPVWVDYDQTTGEIVELPRVSVAALAIPASLQINKNPHNSASQDSMPTAKYSQLRLLPEANPASQQIDSRNDGPKAETLLSDLIHRVRELPGGENTIRKLIGKNGDWSGRAPEAKRRLYGDLRRAYRELASQTKRAS